MKLNIAALLFLKMTKLSNFTRSSAPLSPATCMVQRKVVRHTTKLIQYS